MNERESLTILQRAVSKAIQAGFLSTEQGKTILGVDIVLNPPAVAVRFQSRYDHDPDPVYLDSLFPLYDREWAIAFWGHELTGDRYFGLMPAWKYHQHKLLDFWQNNEQDEFYSYIERYL